MRKAIGWSRDKHGKVVEQHLKDICNTLTTFSASSTMVMNKINQMGNLYDTTKRDHNQGRVYRLDGVSPTLNTCSGGDRMPKVVIGCASRQRGYPPNTRHDIELRGDSVSNSITTINTDYLIMTEDKREQCAVEYEGNYLAIRKLTPFECLRLMGVSEENINKARASMINENKEERISKTRWYNMAGNSIVVHQLAPILEQIFYPTPQRGEQLKLF